MHRRDFLFVLISALGTSVHAGESSPADGPMARFEDDLIARLEGKWRLTRKIRGAQVRNTVSASWVLNHQFLQIHMHDVADPPAYEALILVGYVHSSKEYVAHWCDTYGGKFSAKGLGVRSGNPVEFQFAYPDGPFFNTFTWLPEQDEWILRMESQDAAGKRSLFAIDTLERDR